MSKRLGRIIGCKYKTSSWHSNGFLDGSNIGSTYNTGEKHTVVMLLVIGKEKTFTLYNESTEIFYDVYSETVVS